MIYSVTTSAKVVDGRLKVHIDLKRNDEHIAAGNPRGGQFASKRDSVAIGTPVGAVREGKGKEAKIVLANGSPAPAHIQAAMIPPAWKDVKVYTDPKSEVWVEATNVTKRGVVNSVKVYSPSYAASQQEAKHVRVEQMLKEAPNIDKQIQQGRKNPKTKEEADCALLISKQATRPGSDTDTKGLEKHYGVKVTPDNVIVSSGAKGKTKVELEVNGERIHIRDEGAAAQLIARKQSGEGLHDSTYWLKSHGATTLEGRNVVQGKDGVRLQFMGKEGVWHDHLIKDPEVAKMLTDRAKTAKERDGRLFDTDNTKLASYVKTLDTGRFSPKDFRTKVANEIAARELQSYAGKTPKDAKQREEWIKTIATTVSRTLGNKPAQCVESYINPHVWDIWPSAAA